MEYKKRNQTSKIRIRDIKERIKEPEEKGNTGLGESGAEPLSFGSGKQNQKKQAAGNGAGSSAGSGIRKKNTEAKFAETKWEIKGRERDIPGRPKKYKFRQEGEVIPDTGRKRTSQNQGDNRRIGEIEPSPDDPEADEEDPEEIEDKKITKVIFRKIIAILTSIGTSIATSVLMIFAVAVLFIFMGLLMLHNTVYGIVIDDGETVQQLIQSLTIEYQNTVNGWATSNDCDNIETVGSLAPWTEVIAFWKACEQPMSETQENENYFNGNNYENLKMIFYDFNMIDYAAAPPTLTVTISNRTLQEMEDYYAFTDSQRSYVEELMSDEDLLYGLINQNYLSQTALAEIGNGGTKYREWYYGRDIDVDWCCIFVSWCLDQNGYLAAYDLVKTASCSRNGMIQQMSAKDWLSYSAGRSKDVKVGDIVFFDRNHDASPGNYAGKIEHIGIVTGVSDDVIYITSGNSGTRPRKVTTGTYQYTTPSIFAFARLGGY